MLLYTLNRMLESHLIVVEKDVGPEDSFGAETRREWQGYHTFKGLFWWWPTHGSGKFSEEATDERTVWLTGGGVLMHRIPEFPLEERGYRVQRVIKANGTEVTGPFRIISYRETPSHSELSLERP